MGSIEDTGWLFFPLPGLDTVSNDQRPEAFRITLWILLFNILITNCGFCFAERLKQFRTAKKKNGKTVVVVAAAATAAAWLYGSVALCVQNLIWWRYPYSCWMGINICATIYASTKLLLYLLLIEKTRLLNLTFTPSTGFKPSPVTIKRRDDRLWQANLAFMSPYVIIAVLMLVFQVSKYEADFFSGYQTCTIGLWLESSIPLLMYDAFFTSALSAQMYAGCRTVNSELLRSVAKRNFNGASVATTVSLCNILLLTIVHKNGMPSEMCFATCAIDVFVNIRTVHYVMSGSKRKGIGVTTSNSTYMNKTHMTGSTLQSSNVQHRR